MTAETPETILNRPALGQIEYRTGRYATFLESMLAALSDQSDPQTAPIAGLRTRDEGDFSIALLDSWAVALDILTFYSERLANEAYLRTAAEQRSVIELAALIGYVPSPGVAASATLAFTLLSAPGSPTTVTIPAGTRVQSIPGPGQTAQVFETSADLTALAAWNALPAQTTQPWSLTATEQSTWITGASNNISVGDALLFVATQTGVMEFHYVTAVATDPVAKTTQLTWEAALSTPDFQRGAAMYVFRKKAALFGANAPNPQTLSGPYISEVPGWPGTQPGQYGYPPADPLYSIWDYNSIYNSDPLYLSNTQLALDTSYPGITPSTTGPPLWLALTGMTPWDVDPNADQIDPLTTVFTITSATDRNPGPGLFTLTSRVTVLTVGTNPQTLVNGAPYSWPDTPPDAQTLLNGYVSVTPQVTAYVQSAQLTGAPLPLTDWTSVNSLYPATVERFAGHTFHRQLEPGHPLGMLAPVAGSTVTVVGGQTIAPGQRAGISGKRLRLQVAAPPAGNPGATFTPAGTSGGSDAAAGQVFLIDAFPPVINDSGDAIWSVITVSGVAGTLLIPAASSTASSFLPADNADSVVSEAVIVQGATPAGDVTTLTLNGPLARIYDLATVTVNANALLATNGETVQEILGSGDATNPALTFTLKQAPLTYLPAPVASGAQSTLQVWVNDLRWRETPSLLTAGPADRVYTTSVNAAGNTIVRFGDGTQGGRPPTGQANIRAVYRKGIGSPGMVAAGQLSQPLDRPQGLSAVTNPSGTTGATDPATADEIRASAPLPTLTISRVVSLQDYQDYALGFAGIAKALATWTWSGGLRGVFLTLAGANGATFGPGDPIITSLATALRQYGDPHVPLSVVSYVPARFTFTASVAVDTTSHDPSAVLAQVWQVVSAEFAFGQRSLGQGVAASEIVEVIQDVPGVIAVGVTGLQLSGQPPTAASVLRASGPQPPSGTQPAMGAELLLLDPATQGLIGSWS